LSIRLIPPNAEIPETVSREDKDRIPQLTQANFNNYPSKILLFNHKIQFSGVIKTPVLLILSTWRDGIGE